MEIRTESVANPMPSDELIRKYEDYFKIDFPNSYKEFIKKYNGAVLENKTFVYEEQKYVLERFLCVLEDYQNDKINGWYGIEVIETQIGERLTDNRDLLGAEMIPIAALFAGDFICLDFRNNSENPSICIWYHEQSALFQPVTKKVVDSFEAFLDLLK